MSETLLRYELERLTRLAPHLGERGAGTLADRVDALEREIEALEEELDERRGALRDARDDVLAPARLLTPAAREQLGIVVALHTQYRVPLPEGLAELWEDVRPAPDEEGA